MGKLWKLFDTTSLITLGNQFLISLENVSVKKVANIRWHYTIHHHGNFNKFTGKQNKYWFKAHFRKTYNFFFFPIQKKGSKYSCQLKIFKWITGKKRKSFIDKEFVKGCLLPMVNIICPKMKSSFASISLSARTIPWWVEGNVCNKLQLFFSSFQLHLMKAQTCDVL